MDLPQLERIAVVLEKHLELAKEDLQFRREQAEKSDKTQELLAQVMFGGRVPVEDSSGTARRKRRTEGVANG